MDDFGYENWLETKSRRENKKYPTGHTLTRLSKKDKNAALKHQYISFYKSNNDKNDNLVNYELKCKNNEIYTISLKSIPTDVSFSMNKNKNWLLPNLFDKLKNEIEKDKLRNKINNETTMAVNKKTKKFSKRSNQNINLSHEKIQDSLINKDIYKIFNEKIQEESDEHEIVSDFKQKKLKNLRKRKDHGVAIEVENVKKSKNLINKTVKSDKTFRDAVVCRHCHSHTSNHSDKKKEDMENAICFFEVTNLQHGTASVYKTLNRHIRHKSLINCEQKIDEYWPRFEENRNYRKYTEFTMRNEDIVVNKEAAVNDIKDDRAFKAVSMMFKSIAQWNENKSINYMPLIGIRAYDDISNVNEVYRKELVKTTRLSISNDLTIENLTVSTCDICFDESTKLLELQECNHKACLNCWKTYTENIINSYLTYSSATDIPNNVKKIECIDQNCKNIVTVDFLKKILDEATIQKYIRFYIEFKLARSNCFVKCPRIGCTEVILISAESKGNMSLCKCNFSICNKCHNEAHFPIECEEFSFYKDKTYLGDKNALNITGKFCPKCKVYIEKNGGCSHMRCICSHNFCWTCLKDYNNHDARRCQQVALTSYTIYYFDSPLKTTYYNVLIRTEELISKLNNLDFIHIFSALKNDASNLNNALELNYNIHSKQPKELSDTIKSALQQLNFNVIQLASICKYVAFKYIVMKELKPNCRSMYNIVHRSIQLCDNYTSTFKYIKNSTQLYNLMLLNEKLKRNLNRFHFDDDFRELSLTPV